MGWHIVVAGERKNLAYITYFAERFVDFDKEQAFTTWGERLFSPRHVHIVDTGQLPRRYYHFVGFVNTKAGLAGKQGRHSGGRANPFKSKLRRIVSGTPEVMVKITGGDFSSKMMKKHIDYISRNGDVPLYTESGEEIRERVSKNEIEERWGHELTENGQARYKENYHVIFSMPAGTPRDDFRTATVETIASLFKNHQYYWAEHTDTAHPHIHVVVKACDVEGRRLKTKKADLQRWRERYAQTLREHGLQAEASKRAQRGKLFKHDKTAIYRLKERGFESEADKRLKTEQQQVAAAGNQYKETEAVKKARRTRYAVNHIYKNMIAELKKSQDSADQKLAAELQRYVRSLRTETPQQQRYYERAKQELSRANKLQQELLEQKRITITKSDMKKER